MFRLLSDFCDMEQLDRFKFVEKSEEGTYLEKTAIKKHEREH